MSVMRGAENFKQTEKRNPNGSLIQARNQCVHCVHLPSRAFFFARKKVSSLIKSDFINSFDRTENLNPQDCYS